MRGGKNVEGQISRRIDAGTKLVLQNHYIATPVVPIRPPSSIGVWMTMAIRSGQRGINAGPARAINGQYRQARKLGDPFAPFTL